MKMNKRIMSLVLALGLMTSASSIFAADVTDLAGLAEAEVVVSGSVTLPTIKVTLPTSATFKIDPFNVAGEGQIASTEFKVINESDVAVDVVLNEYKVNIDAATSKVVLATTPTISATSVKNDVFLRIEAAKGTDDYAAFDAKKDAKKIVKVGKGLNENLGTLAAKPESGDAEELRMQFAGAVNSNVVWTADDTIEVTPVFKISPQVLVTP